MTIIIDRRGTTSSKNMTNRERFIKRFKRRMKTSLDRVIRQKSISDTKEEITVPVDWSTTEEDITFDKETGEREVVISGNEQFEKGDRIPKPQSGSSGPGGSGDGEDTFMFTLTKEEFFDLYFQDMHLPDFIKESMLDTTKNQYKRAGYIKDGIPARLDVLKTLEMSIARRISCSDKDKKPPFLDDVDLRYKHYKDVPQPMLKAVMFCMMDVSGSMLEHHKTSSKKFFILLYLFLTKNYESVELRFIRYHHTAADVDEMAFFYSKETGGTEVLAGLDLVNKIIEEEYSPELYNIYIAHTSDGDMGYEEMDKIVPYLDNTLLEKVQYYAYLEVQTSGQYVDAYLRQLYVTLKSVLQKSAQYGKKLNAEACYSDSGIFGALRNLFKRGGRDE